MLALELKVVNWPRKKHALEPVKWDAAVSFQKKQQYPEAI